MKIAYRIIGLGVLVVAQLAHAQLGVGENTKLSAGGLIDFGYSGDYGDQIPSSHGLNLGFSGAVNGYYYNPNFLSFSATPYYNQSRANSESQSITGAGGITGTGNFFTGSNFPGSVTYHYDRNSTQTMALAGQPTYTTYGSGKGFGIDWSALVPNWPTLAVGYSQGSGSGSIFGTDQQTESSQRMFNAHSNYSIAGFLLNAIFTHNSFHSVLPEFLTGAGSEVSTSSANNFGVGAQHRLPLNGTLSLNFTRSSSTSDYSSVLNGDNSGNASSYTDNVETATANFHPTPKLTYSASESYTSNLTGYLAQNLGTGGVAPPGLNLGVGAHSFTAGGGVAYRFTDFLSGSGQASYYDQSYLGHSYSGEFLSGTLDFTKRLLNMLSFSATVIEFNNGQGQNAVGFAGNVNFFRRFGGWATTAQFSYAQNVQTLLITYTTSSYQYGASIHRKLAPRANWSATFGGNHSGLSENPSTSNHSESYSTSLSLRGYSASAYYNQSSGISVLGLGGLIVPQPTPGLENFLRFNGSSYGGSASMSLFRNLSIGAAYSRAISRTFDTTLSRNNTEVFSAQMRYHLRKTSLQAGYLHFNQGISAIGAPASTTSFYVGMSRWFDFF